MKAMRLYFTKSQKPLSRLIRWGLNEPCSHFAIGFSDRLLFQSNLLGTGIEWLPRFLNEQTVVYEIVIPMDEDVQDRIYDRIMPIWDGWPYDWKAFLFLGWRAALKKFFGRPFPAKNPWQDKKAYLCVGLVRALDTDEVPDWLRVAVRNVGDDSVFPYGLYQSLRGAQLGATEAK